mgnify:CR=1 FL=1
MVKAKEDWEIKQEEEDEKKLYDQYYGDQKRPGTFDFIKGIVSGISGDEAALRGMLKGNKDQIAQAGQNITPAMFSVQLANLGAGMVAGGIGSRAGGRAGLRSVDPLEYSKIKWYKNIPKGGFRGREGRFQGESKTYTPKEFVEQISKKWVGKTPLTEAQKVLMENSPEIRAKILDINSRPNYYRALGSVRILTEVRGTLQKQIKKLTDETALDMANSRGNFDNLPASFLENMKELQLLKKDVSDLSVELSQHEADSILYEKNENATGQVEPEIKPTEQVKLENVEEALEGKELTKIERLMKSRDVIRDELTKVTDQLGEMDITYPKYNELFRRQKELQESLDNVDKEGQNLDKNFWVNEVERNFKTDIKKKVGKPTEGRSTTVPTEGRSTTVPTKVEIKVSKPKVEKVEPTKPTVEKVKTEPVEKTGKEKYDEERAERAEREKRNREQQEAEEQAEENERPNFDDPVEEDPVETDPVETEPVETEPTETDPLIKKNKPVKPVKLKAKKKVKESKKPGKPFTQPINPVVLAPNNTKTFNQPSRRVFGDAEEEFIEINAMGNVEGTSTSSSGYSSSIKSTLDRANIDELLTITLKLSEDAYFPEIGREEFYDYVGQFDVPILFYLRNRVQYISFRGTDSISNMLTDIQTVGNRLESNLLNDYEFIQNKLSSYFGNIKFHSGFIKATLQSYQFIEEQLRQNSNAYDSIVVTGHSLGGAISQLFSYIYNNSNTGFEGKKPIKYVVTYGQPRALFDNPDYIEKYNNSVPNFIRCWNTNDPVPYFPFKKKVSIDNTLGTNIMSGYTHVGKSFNLKENLSNNNINILAYELIQGSTKQLIEMLSLYNLEETEQGLALLTDKKYLSLLTYCYYENLKVNEIKKDVTKDKLENLNVGVQEQMIGKKTVKEKCDIIKPFGISDLLEANPIVDDLDPIKNFQLSSISAITTLGNKVFARAHNLITYQAYLDKLLNKQIEQRQTLFEIVEERPYLDKEEKVVETIPQPKVIGIVNGEFNNKELISF